jgi:hypothetical protein
MHLPRMMLIPMGAVPVSVHSLWVSVAAPLYRIVSTPSSSLAQQGVSYSYHHTKHGSHDKKQRKGIYVRSWQYRRTSG